MRHSIFGLLALATITVPAHSDNDEVRRGPVPVWAMPSELMDVPADASGLVFVRRNDVFVHLDSEGQQQYFGYRMKLLHSNALQLGNLSIAWDPDAGAPILHTLRVHRASQVIDLIATADFEILRREENLEAAHLNGILTAVLRVPDLRVGDELEFAITTQISDPTLGGLDAGLLLLAPDPPAGRQTLAISWEDGYHPTLRMTPDMQAAQERQPNAARFRFDNPPTIAPIQDAPPRYGWQRLIEYSDYADWAAVSRKFAPLYDAASRISDRSPLRQEAARIAAEHTDPLARAGAALELVQQQVRYVYVGLDGGNLTPAAADETWDRRYGDCKGKTVVLLALLRELGIEASAVLVSNSGIDDGLNERLPNPGLFDHVLVRASIGGTEYWLDGTMPPVVPPSPTPVVPYEWVLPLAVEGRALEHRPWRAPSTPDNITLLEIDARAGFDQPAQITHTTIVRGIEGLAEQVQLSALSPGRLLNAFRQNVNGQPWQTIDDVEWRYDIGAQASVLTIRGTQFVDWDEYNPGRRLSLPGGGFNPPQRRMRAGEQGQHAPFYNEPGYNCFVTTVRVPETTQPSNWSFNSSFDTHIFGRNYYRAFELRDGTIRMVRGSRVEKDEIPAAAARADNARIADFDNSMAWIYYDPIGRRGPARNQESVPATYEIDWTADNVPCLSSNATW